jgi:signal transduction protein with GAF and PtsI domain
LRGVLSVPVRLAERPVGTLDVYTTRPRAWTAAEVEALGALAVVTAELVSTGVELANREGEVAQLRQALTIRIWIEQAKGVLGAAQGVSPAAAFHRLRAREAKQALEAAQTGLARRTAALDWAQDAADEREQAADQRNHLADQRKRTIDARERAADEPE